MNTNTNIYTELENYVIDGFIRNDYGFFDEGLVAGSDTWSDIFIEECGDAKIYRGVVSSLIKKGFFRSSTWVERGAHALYLTELAEAEIAARLEAHNKNGNA